MSQRFHDAFVHTMLCFVRWSRSSPCRSSTVRMEALDPVEERLTALPFANQTNKEQQQKTKEEQLAAFLTDLGISLTVAVLASVVLRYYSGRLLSDNNKNDTEQRSRAAVQADLRKNTLVQQRAAHNHVDWRHLSAYEIQVADGIVDPEQMDCAFADMGGMDEIKHKVFATVLAPLYRPDLYTTASKLRTTPRGILFYGPPGTGKTMMVQCMATEAKAILIPLKGSTLLNKYWGESNKMVAAAFSLAHKLQPAILFIDELDNFLPRNGGGHADTALMDSIKAEFLTLWEGIGTNAASKVLVVGATNRPERIDTAILRRMPCAIELPLPNEASRLDILRKILKDEPCDATVAEALPLVAAATNHYSGSDLHEVCKHAANIPIQEITHEFARRRVMGEDVENETNEDTEPERVRPMRASDVWEGVKAIRPTGEAAARYGRERRAAEPDGLDERAVAPLIRLLLQGLQQGSNNSSSNGRRPPDENSDDVPSM